MHTSLINKKGISIAINKNSIFEKHVLMVNATNSKEIKMQSTTSIYHKISCLNNCW